MSYDDFDPSIPATPVVKQGSVIVYDIGDLSKGLYYYVITAMGYTCPQSESFPSHIIQVYARNRHNSIALSWGLIPGVEEYRIYRGSSPDQFDGYFAIGPTGYFCDTGYGLLNEERLNPPVHAN